MLPQCLSIFFFFFKDKIWLMWLCTARFRCRFFFFFFSFIFLLQRDDMSVHVLLLLTASVLQPLTESYIQTLKSKTQFHLDKRLTFQECRKIKRWCIDWTCLERETVELGELSIEVWTRCGRCFALYVGVQGPPTPPTPTLCQMQLGLAPVQKRPL